ncbi:MAG: DNA alkylation repair protein [Burkholderiaceae bacterium]
MARSAAREVEGARGALRAFGCSAHAAALHRFFQADPGGYGEGDRFLGVRMPDLRRVARQFRDLSIEALRALLRSRIHEERLLALVIMTERAKRADDDGLTVLYELYMDEIDHVDNWDLVDTSAAAILGAWLRGRSRAPLDELARSPNLWHRRVAVIASGCFIRQGEYGDTLRLAEQLLGDREDLIHKAVGWMLRLIGDRDRAVAEAFLQAHGSRMPRTMLRYAIEKFPPDLRRHYLLVTR